MAQADLLSPSRDSMWEQTAPSDGTLRTAELSRIGVLTQFARQKWTIVKITAAFFLVGLALCVLLPVRYKSEAKIMPPKEEVSLSNLLSAQTGSGMGALAGMATRGLGLQDPNAPYIGMLESRPVADAMIKRFNLMSLYKSKNMTDARRQLASRSKIESDKSTFISIQVQDKDRQRAADMANAYVEELEALSKTVGFSETSKRRIFYEKQLTIQRDNLSAAEVALQQIEEKKGLLHLNSQVGAIVSNVAMARAEIAAKRVELQALKSFSTEHNPDVKLAEESLSALETETSKMSQHGTTAEFADLGLKDLPAAGLDWVRAVREVDFNQDVYALLLKQYEAARLDEANDEYIIQLVQSAVPPDKRSFPVWLVCPPLFTFLGFLASYLAVRIKVWFKNTQADPERAAALRDLVCALTGK